jgi:hypothetical protein
MRPAFTVVLFASLSVAGQEKKPEKLTAENIEIGKVGTIDKLTVEKTENSESTKLEDHIIIAGFDGLRVMIVGYSAKGIGKGKVLPKDQLWKVESILKMDSTGEGLTGCYILRPHKIKK